MTEAALFIFALYAFAVGVVGTLGVVTTWPRSVFSDEFIQRLCRDQKDSPR